MEKIGNVWADWSRLGWSIWKKKASIKKIAKIKLIDLFSILTKCTDLTNMFNFRVFVKRYFFVNPYAKII